MVEKVVESKIGWAPEITVRLKDGSIKKGKLSDFREASQNEKNKHTEGTEKPAEAKTK